MGHRRISLFSSSSWSSVDQSSDSTTYNHAVADTPRSSRAKRRLAEREHARSQDHHEEPGGRTSTVTPGLFGSDESSDEDSLYRPTPRAPDRNTFTRESEEIDDGTFDGTESEIEWFELYGELRPKYESLNDVQGKRETWEDEGVEREPGSDPMDICTDDEQCGVVWYRETNGISTTRHLPAPSA